jgi:hypothetical protein
MKRMLCLTFAILTTHSAQAGGNTSIAEIASVTSVKLEERKIIIVGTGVVRFPVMTTPEHQTQSSEVRGHKTQWVYAKTTGGVFEIIPYFSRHDIEGVGTGGHTDRELQTLSAKGWAEAVETCKRIKPGDQITIGYQGDQRLIDGYQVMSAVGWGSITIHPEQSSAGQTGAD